MQSGDESDGAAALSDFLSGWETDVGDLPDDQSSLEAEINEILDSASTLKACRVEVTERPEAEGEVDPDELYLSKEELAQLLFVLARGLQRLEQIYQSVHNDPFCVLPARKKSLIYFVGKLLTSETLGLIEIFNTRLLLSTTPHLVLVGILNVLVGLDTSLPQIILYPEEELLEKVLAWIRSPYLELRAPALALFGRMLSQPVVSDAIIRAGPVVPYLLDLLHDRLSHLALDGPLIETAPSSPVQHEGPTIGPPVTPGQLVARALSSFVPRPTPAPSAASSPVQEVGHAVTSPSTTTTTATTTTTTATTTNTIPPNSVMMFDLPVSTFTTPQVHPPNVLHESFTEVTFIGPSAAPTMKEMLSQELLEVLMALGPLAAYHDFLRPFYHHKGMHSVAMLMAVQTGQVHPHIVPMTMYLLGELVAHRKFCMDWVAAGSFSVMWESRKKASPAANSVVARVLHGLASTVGAMGTICTSDSPGMDEIIAFVVSVLEGTDDSATRHMVRFLSAAFSYPGFLARWTELQGDRALVHLARNIINQEDDAGFSRRSLSSVISAALAQYFRAHVTILASELRSNITGAPLPDLWKPLDTPSSHFLAIIHYVMAASASLKSISGFSRSSWAPITSFLSCHGLALISHSFANTTSQDTIDTASNYLDVAMTVALTRQGHAALSKPLPLHTGEARPGEEGVPIFTLLYRLKNNRELLFSTLTLMYQLLVSSYLIPYTALLAEQANFQQDPGPNPAKEVAPLIRSTMPHAAAPMRKDDVRKALFKHLRSHSGIRTLIGQLSSTHPPTQADLTRLCAALVLIALTDDPDVCKLLETLQVSLTVAELAREPVLAERAATHALFRRAAHILIARTSGRAARTALTVESGDSIVRKVEKAAVVSQTNITYPRTELLALIHEHLRSTGLSKTADALASEAALYTVPSNKAGTPAPSFLLKDLPASSSDTFQKHRTLLREKRLKGRRSSLLGKRPVSDIHPVTPSAKSSRSMPPPRTPLSGTSAPLSRGWAMSPFTPAAPPPPGVSLDHIVKEYLRGQHRRCKNPIAVLPPISLYGKHSCPKTTKYVSTAGVPGSIVGRVVAREGTGQLSSSLPKFVWSRFRRVRSFREPDRVVAVAAVPHQDKALVGLRNGSVKRYNNASMDLELDTMIAPVLAAPLSVHPVNITKVLMSSPLAGLKLLDIEDVHYPSVKYEHHSLRGVFMGADGSSVLATLASGGAAVLDTESGALMAELKRQSETSLYHQNLAVAHPNGDLVLNNAVLWDVRVPAPVHTFDRISDLGAASFHPFAPEVIINSEVWDMRSFGLLHKRQDMAGTRLVWSASGAVAYAAPYLEPRRDRETSDTSWFRTVDGRTYNTIHTEETAGSVVDLAVTSDEFRVIVAEDNPGSLSAEPDSRARVYDVGRGHPATDWDSDEYGSDDEDQLAEEEHVGARLGPREEDAFRPHGSGDDIDDSMLTGGDGNHDSVIEGFFANGGGNSSDEDLLEEDFLELGDDSDDFTGSDDMGVGFADTEDEEDEYGVY